VGSRGHSRKVCNWLILRCWSANWADVHRPAPGKFGFVTRGKKTGKRETEGKRVVRQWEEL